MNPRGLLPIVEPIADDLLAVSVDVEVDRACRDDTDQIGSEALEKSSPAFCLGNLPQDLSRFTNVKQRAASERHGLDRW